MARRYRKQHVSKEIITTDIESLAHDGRGIARIDGKTVFIDGALAGETVRFQYFRYHKNFDEARVCITVSAVVAI